ncbi:MAG: aminopeptidase P family protein [candidate division Zixibacteria bacterium]|nr:aminopeptidase P family protein [candidate division Zixibacteria bacterium]
MSTKRINALRAGIAAANLDGYIVTDMKQIRYLTGFSGSAGILVIDTKRADFFTDSRYTIQARKEVKGARVNSIKSSALTCLKDFPKLNRRNFRYGFCGEALTVTGSKHLQSTVPDSLLIPADDLVAELGWVKEPEELVSIKKAVEISDTAFERILNLVTPGVRERELAAELEYQMTMLGSEGPAFESIVASGYRSAMPHGVASDKKVRKGDFVTFDFGALVDGYCSDITRTVVVGKADAKQKKIYNIVLKAHLAGIRKIKPGVTGVAVDAACRNLIAKAGYGKYFGHGTGHGISLEVHSGPRLSPLSDNKLKPNNVVTVEPGIYITGWGGVRIEDDVLVTRTGAKPLNRAEKKLLEL